MSCEATLILLRKRYSNSTREDNGHSKACEGNIKQDVRSVGLRTPAKRSSESAKPNDGTGARKRETGRQKK